MLQRLKTAIPLLILVALAFALPGAGGALVFILLAFAMIACALHEVYAMLKPQNGHSYQILTTVFAILLFGQGASLMWDELEITVIALFLLSSALLMFHHGPYKEEVYSWALSLGVFFYLCWPMNCLVKLYFLEASSGRWLLLYIVAVTKLADVGAYVVGATMAKRAGGNHLLAPVLSPKKSWEGLIGGTVFSFVAALLLARIPCMISLDGEVMLNGAQIWVTGIAASVIGLLGDLAESALKRAANVKDSGHLPGIGGILDVLDSLVFVAPLFYALILWNLL